MRGKLSSIFWGLIFIIAGGLILADRLSWIDFSQFSTNTWVYIFGAAGLVFLLGYFVSGFRNWGLLFPALILGSIGLTMWLSDRGVEGSILGMPILLAIAIPFYVGYLLDRKAWPLLIPAWVMTVIAFITWLGDKNQGPLIGALFMFAVTLPFLLVYLLDRSRWWALIPAWATFILGAVILISEHVDGNLVAALIMFGIALPFLVVYLRNRANRWALIPAMVLGAIGVIPLIASVTAGDWQGVIMMLLFAAIFYFIYFRWTVNWWAIIPAGVFSSIALTIFVSILLPENSTMAEGITRGVLLLGFGLTFGALWLLRSKYTTAWARWPALGLFLAAILAFVVGAEENLMWAIVLLVGGVALVVYALLRQKTTV